METAVYLGLCFIHAVNSAKTQLRKRIIEERNSLPDSQWRQRSDRIRELLLSWDGCRKADSIHIFCSYRKEVDTMELLKLLLRSGKTVGCPVLLAGGLLEHRRIRSLSDLSLSAKGILEPAKGDRMEDTSFELILVPGLAFDRQGNRLGYGLGCYDRFLAKATGIKLGLCFGFQLLDSLPAMPHDEKMDSVLTESGFSAAHG